MWTVRVALAFALSVLLAPPASADAANGVDAELQKRINRAIDKGVLFLTHADNALAAEPSRRSYPLGADVLVAYTLLTCGVSKDRPELAELIERAARAPYLVDQTYTLSLALLTLLKADPQTHRAAIVLLIARLEAGQIDAANGKGAWNYDLPEGRSVAGDAGAKGAKKDQRIAGGHWPAPVGWWDNSNTQYAVLALRSAVDFGFQVDGRVFVRAAEHLLQCQDQQGGIGYGKGIRESSYTSMTAGGVGALAMCADVLDAKKNAELRRRIDRAVAAGGDWLGSRLRWPATDSGWPYYAAYAIERLGHYAHAPRFGKHEWYPEGARWLVDDQSENGAFGARGGFEGRSVSGDAVDTCFALLFLKRASAVHTEESDEIYVLLRGLDPQASEADLSRVRNRILEVKDAALPQLAKALYLDNPAARNLADECLRTLTGEDFGYTRARDEAEARAARDAWIRYVMHRRRDSAASDG